MHPASQCSGVCAWSSGVRVCRDTGCHVLSPECGVARGQAFLHVLVADPSKQLPLPAKGSGCLQGLDTKSGGGLQWIFPPNSDAFFFPFVYSLGHARAHVHCRGRLRKEKAHGVRGIMVLQMQEAPRNSSAKCILHGLAAARITSTCGFAAPCSAQLCMDMSKTPFNFMDVSVACGHAFGCCTCWKREGSGAVFLNQNAVTCVLCVSPSKAKTKGLSETRRTNDWACLGSMPAAASVRCIRDENTNKERCIQTRSQSDVCTKARSRPTSESAGGQNRAPRRRRRHGQHVHAMKPG